MTEQEKQERMNRAAQLHADGFGCCQAVVASFADLYGMTQEQALRVSASFGGGIARMHGVCGAASGMFMLAGLDCGATDAKDREAKKHNYEVTRHLAEEWKRRTGSLICAELLGIKVETPMVNTIMCPLPEVTKLNCHEKCALAAEIYVDYLNSKDKE